MRQGRLFTDPFLFSEINFYEVKAIGQDLNFNIF